MKLIILSAGGYGRTVADIARQSGKYTEVCFLDDNSTDELVIGKCSDYSNHITAVGGWLGYFLGGMDGLLTALIIFMAIDYITGLMCAVADKTLSSSVGFKGICKKMLIILLVGVAHIIDFHVVGAGNALRSAVVCFYLSNEGVSLLENAAHLGLPIPEKLKTVLQQLHNRDTAEDNDTAIENTDEGNGV